jgi:hypothetical protein
MEIFGLFINLTTSKPNIDMENNTPEFELKKLEFEKSLQLRNYEIDNFWKRGWFFGFLLIAVLTGYFGLKKDHASYCIIVSFLGLLISFFQSLMNRGSKYWQERWENKTKHKESILRVDITKTKKFDETERYYLDAGILAKNENIFTVARRISVSKITILVWDIITFFWFALWFHDGNFHLCKSHSFYYCVRWNVVAFHIFIISYIIIFFWLSGPARKKWYHILRKDGGKVYEPLMKEKGRGKKQPDNIRNPYFEDSEKYVKNDFR